MVTPDNPNPLPTETDISDVNGLANYIGNNPNVGWRNVSLGDGSGIIEKTLAFSQGSAEDTIYIMITAKNAPGGAEVAFSTSREGPNPPLVLQKTQIPNNQPIFNAGIYSLVPAYFNANIVYRYYSNGRPPTGDFSVEMSYFTFTPQGAEYQHLYEQALDIRHLPLRPHEIDSLRAKFGSGDDDVPRAFLLGQHTTLDSGVGFVANACA